MLKEKHLIGKCKCGLEVNFTYRDNKLYSVWERSKLLPTWVEHKCKFVTLDK